MTDLDKIRVPLPLRSGSPLRRYLRTEKAAASFSAYQDVCAAWSEA